MFVLAAVTGCDRQPPAQETRPDSGTAAAPTPAPVESAAVASVPGLSRAALLGGWSADGENFVWVVEADSILFEADMLRHPYRIAGDTLIIDRGDPTIGLQKTRVTRVTADSLYIEDAQFGSAEVLIKLRN